MTLLKPIPNHIIVAGSSWISRIIISFIQLYMIKILLDILGMDNYAVFSVITGIMGWFMLADFGIGMSIQNYISEYRAKDRDYNFFLNVSILLVILISFLVILLIYVISFYLGNFLLENFKFLDYKERFFIFFVSGSIFVLMNVGSIIYKIWYAEMKGYFANIIPLIGYIISFFVIFFLKTELKNFQDKLLTVILIYFLPGVMLSVYFLIKRIDFDYIKTKTIDDLWDVVYKIFKRGAKFWIFAVMSAIVLQIDYVIMAKYLKANEIVIYNVTSRIFMFGFFIYSSVLSSLWPVFSEKISKGEIKNVNLKIKKYLVAGIFYMIVFILIFLIFKDMIVNIISHEINISIKFIIIFGLYYVIRVWTDMYAMVLQSSNILKPFFILVPIQAFISVLSQIILVKSTGIYGIVLGISFSFIFTVMFGLPYYAKKYLFKENRYVL